MRTLHLRRRSATLHPNEVTAPSEKTYYYLFIYSKYIACPFSLKISYQSDERAPPGQRRYSAAHAARWGRIFQRTLTPAQTPKIAL